MSFYSLSSFFSDEYYRIFCIYGRIFILTFVMWYFCFLRSFSYGNLCLFFGVELFHLYFFVMRILVYCQDTSMLDYHYQFTIFYSWQFWQSSSPVEMQFCPHWSNSTLWWPIFSHNFIILVLSLLLNLCIYCIKLLLQNHQDGK